jgi:hypothetical protein
VLVLAGIGSIKAAGLVRERNAHQRFNVFRDADVNGEFSLVGPLATHSPDTSSIIGVGDDDALVD